MLTKYSNKKLTINDLMRVPHLALAVITLLWLNVGVYTYISHYMQDTIKLLVFAIWFGMACFFKRNYFINYIVRIMPLIIFYGILFLISLLNYSSALELYISTFRYLFIVYSIFLYYINDYNHKLLWIITVILCIDLLYVGFNTYIQLQINPSIARYLATSSDLQRVLLGAEAYQGIGSYSYAYSIVIIELLFLFNLIYGDKHKTLSVIGFVAVLVLLINMQFTIAILLSLIFGCYLVFAKVATKNTAFIGIAFIVIILLLVFVFLPNMFDFLSNVDFIPDNVSVRFNEVSLFLQGSDIDGTDMSERLRLYSISLKTFFQHIFIGTLTGTIGNHSAWLDLLGRLGLLSIPLFVFFIREYKYIVSKLNIKCRIYVKTCYLYFLILGFINTAFFAQLFVMLFIMVPFFAFLYENKVKSTNMG